MLIIYFSKNVLNLFVLVVSLHNVFSTVTLIHSSIKLFLNQCHQYLNIVNIIWKSPEQCNVFSDFKHKTELFTEARACNAMKHTLLDTLQS